MPNLSLVNHGRMEFGASNYFTCTTCSVTNIGEIWLTNPDGWYGHTFLINAGTFDNTGLIIITGYYPGVDVSFGPSATVPHRGQAQLHNLSQPTWIQTLPDSSFVQGIANVVNLSLLANKLSLYAEANLLNIGIGSCANANFSSGILGASIGICLVAAPNGQVVISLSVAGNVMVYNATGGQPISQMVDGAGDDAVLDAGMYVLWRTGEAGDPSFDPATDIDGPFMCETGTIAFDVAVSGQHCWGGANDVPWSLDSSWPVTEPGIHTGFLGVGGGAGGSLFLGESYSVLISCGEWYSITMHPCPPVNNDLPIISGTPAVGSTLTTSTGDWGGAPTSYSYQWMRCSNALPESCFPVAGAITNQHIIVEDDKGWYIRVAVTATNASGQVTSNPSPAVFVPTG
jgi:hypothetical protein